MLYTKLAGPQGLARSLAVARQLSTLTATSTILARVKPSAASSLSQEVDSALQTCRAARSYRSSSVAQAVRGLSQTSKSKGPAAAAAAAPQESLQDDEAILSQSEQQHQPKAARVKDETFASLKGSIHPSILKALTVKPFAYTNMSAVQQSVLHSLPELANSVGESATPMPMVRGETCSLRPRPVRARTIAFLVPALEARLRSIEDVRNGKFPKPWLDMLQRHRPDLDVSSLKKKELEEIVKQFVNNTVGTLVLSPTRELATPNC